MNNNDINHTTPTIHYSDAGVNIDTGNSLIESIKPIVAKTYQPGVISALGGFSGLFELPQGYKKPVIVTSTDGVGTKLKLTNTAGKYNTIGIDLVAMCVNDLAVCGAKPLVFLDYYATSKLDISQAKEVIKGVAQGCQIAQCSLIGGETAEMPGLYQNNDYDIAGFSVGIVEKTKIIDGTRVRSGDMLIGLESSGCHSNGFSLINTLLTRYPNALPKTIDDKPLLEALLTPTRIYTNALSQLQNKVPIKAISHITGGGLTENLPRTIPRDYDIIINRQSWEFSELFQWIQKSANISDNEMLRTFNCGIGMVLCLSETNIEKALDHLKKSNEKAIIIGHIEDRNNSSEGRIEYRS